MPRPKNSVSMMKVSLKELNRIFQPEASIPVWTRWAKENDLVGKPMDSNTENLRSMSSRVEVELIDLGKKTAPEPEEPDDFSDDEMKAQIEKALAEEVAPKTRRVEKRFKAELPAAWDKPD